MTAKRKPAAQRKTRAQRKGASGASDAAAKTAKSKAPKAPPAFVGEDRLLAFADDLVRQQEAQPQVEAAPVRLSTWLTLQLAGEVFALPIEPIQEVVRVSAITRVPHAPYPVRGVTNLRGRVIPVIDFRRRLELPEAEHTETGRVVVVRSFGRVLGLLVDAVHQVLRLDLNQVRQPPSDVVSAQSEYVVGVYELGETLILLVDVDRVLRIRDATTT